MAFLDRELSGTEVEGVEKLIDSDAEVAEFVEHMKHNEPPFQQAFDELLLTPIPKSAQQLIDQSLLDESTSHLSGWKYAVAASLLLGVLLGGELTVAWNDIGKNEPPDWIAQVANYQSLYIRPTVAESTIVDWPKLNKIMVENLGRQLPVPRFQSAAIEFKRGQLLQVNRNPLLQLAYLPKSGIPLALCVMRNAKMKQDQGVSELGTGHGLGYASWHDQDLHFVLVGDLSISELEQLKGSAMQQLSAG